MVGTDFYPYCGARSQAERRGLAGALIPAEQQRGAINRQQYVGLRKRLRTTRKMEDLHLVVAGQKKKKLTSSSDGELLRSRSVTYRLQMKLTRRALCCLEFLCPKEARKNVSNSTGSCSRLNEPGKWKGQGRWRLKGRAAWPYWRDTRAGGKRTERPGKHAGILFFQSSATSKTTSYPAQRLGLSKSEAL